MDILNLRGTMNGIRVSNIPIQLSERLLRKYFSDPVHGGGEIKSIYYPLINNDAVIIYQNEITAVTAVVKKAEENAGSFRVAPLPHQVFSCVDVHLEPGLSIFVLTTNEYIKTLKDWGLQVSTGIVGPEICTLSGSWYKVEWAWNYLSQIMEKQHAIHHRVQSQISQEDSDVSNDYSDHEFSPDQYRVTNGAEHQRPSTASNKRSEASRKSNGRRIQSLQGQPEKQSPSIRSSNQSRQSQQNASLLHDDNDVDFHNQLGLSLTSSVGESLAQSSSANKRARDADSTFNHFTSLQSRESPRHQVRDIISEGAASARSSTSDRNQETYRVASPAITGSPDRNDLPVINDEVDNDLNESETDTIHDRHSVASGHSDTPRNSLRLDEATNDVRREEYSRASPSRTRYGGSSSFQMDEEVPDGYKSQSLKIGDIKVKIYLADITQATSEAIVNAANCELKNFSGVARAIAKAAGESLERECDHFIRSHGRLDTTHVMHTSGGNLKKFKYILHTVGPIYIGAKYRDECLFQLTQTFFNCLTYTEEKLYLKSLALPFISTGVYAAPLEDCVASFIDAVLIFIHKYRGSCKLSEVHLVNNDINIVSMASTLFQSILDGADFDQMTDDAVRRFEMKNVKDPFTRSFTATGASGARPKDTGSGSMRRCSSMDYLNQDSSLYGRETSSKSYDYDRKDMIGAAGTSSSVRPQRSGSFSSSPKKFSQPQSPKLSSSRDLASHSTSRYTSDQRSMSHRTSGAAKTYSVQDSNATASSISQSLKKNISQNHNRSPRSSTSPMKALPTDHRTETRKSKAGGSGAVSRSVADRLSQARSADSMTSLPVDLNNERSRRAADPEIETCGICLDEILQPKVLDKCGHKFCQGCLKHAFVCKPVCPECGMIYGVIIGDQPRGGKMMHKVISSHKLEGYKDADGILEIIYTFSDGVQHDNHPNPGYPYSGLKRKGYLPNNKEGQELLQLLYKAFDARLIFTIGESRTTGETGVLTWNDIHHKTSMTGGPMSYGYPDPGYLKRLREELALKGIKK